MSLRIRKDGRMFCAATNPEMEGDVYINDGLHYDMSVMHGIICTYPEPKHTENGGEWWWSNNAPEGAWMDHAEERDFGRNYMLWEDH